MLFLAACSGGSTPSSGTTPPSPPSPPPPSAANEWTWMSGSNTGNSLGVYGTQGTPSASSVPGGRYNSVSWIDKGGNFWLFSGNVYGQSGTSNPNDLWEYNPSANQWAFMGGRTDACIQSGSVCRYAWPGVYGTKGVASSTNIPGGRSNAVSWTDANGDFWLFGGIGFDSTETTLGPLNDLWMYSPTTKLWTWISGSSQSVAVDSSGDYGQLGVYGSQGVPSASNVPGGRYGSVSWLDQSGNLWLFGGYGYASTTTGGNLNDLWEFNPTTQQWAWMAGSYTVNASGNFGSLGTPASTNVPGSRHEATGWIDNSGNFWLFGGSGFISTAANGELNDLWEFNLATKTWTWVSGSNSANAPGFYGTLGTGSANNTPGARWQSVSWTDSSGNLWLFGGNGYNDLWKFAPTTKTWTWVSGSSTSGAQGVYGTEGAAATGNVPGARGGSAGWTDRSGNLWLFGGSGIDSSGIAGRPYLNDLWRYQP